MSSRGARLDHASVFAASVGSASAVVGGAVRVTDDANDLERFLALVERHTPPLLKVTSALVGFADAEDAAQEAVVKAWQARTSLRDPEKLRPWLLRIAVNVCREWRRGRFGLHQRLQQALPDDSERALATLESDPGASDAAAGLDLRDAINALDHDLRLIVVLRYYGGMDATEIGTALAIPPATVRTRLRRALTVLRQRLRDSGPLPGLRQREGGTHV